MNSRRRGPYVNCRKGGRRPSKCARQPLKIEQLPTNGPIRTGGKGQQQPDTSPSHAKRSGLINSLA
jgi:hypothetical protein